MHPYLEIVAFSFFALIYPELLAGADGGVPAEHRDFLTDLFATNNTSQPVNDSKNWLGQLLTSSAGKLSLLLVWGLFLVCNSKPVEKRLQFPNFLYTIISLV